ncbi:DUF4142 domain-containing protein [Kozakia baliensis]|uniref:DUF4142 domain-containing protein n=1 Tax=Kozakia baliensis TaxID=153496 RepID=UPI00345B5FBB
MKRYYRVLSTTLPLLALTACGVPKYPHAPELPAKAPPFQTADAAFIQFVNENDVMQIELGKLATDHSASAKVKELAANLVKDHTDNRTKLSAIVAKHDMTLTETPMKEDKEKLEDIGKLHGARFDRAYLAEVEKSHKTIDTQSSNEVASTKDGDLKTVASATQVLDQKYIAQAYSLLPQRAARHYHRR